MVTAEAGAGKRYNPPTGPPITNCADFAMPTSSSAREQITAVILAGGSGTRLGGCDKAQLEWRGRPFIDHIIERLAPQVSTIAVNSNDPDNFRSYPLPVITDTWPERRGPLAGILAGLRHSTTPLVLFTPCDSPNIPPQLALRLLEALREDVDIAYATSAGQHHYLFSLLRSELRDDLQRFIEAGGRAVHRWFERHRVGRVAFDDQPDCFINVNTAADHKLLP
jgi:molybdopterin-guanine dinucleotide biosynthesis protein A